MCACVCGAYVVCVYVLSALSCHISMALSMVVPTKRGIRRACALGATSIMRCADESCSSVYVYL